MYTSPDGVLIKNYKNAAGYKFHTQNIISSLIEKIKGFKQVRLVSKSVYFPFYNRYKS